MVFAKDAEISVNAPLAFAFLCGILCDFAVNHSHIEIKIEVYDKNWIYQSRLSQEPRGQRSNDGAAQAKGL